MKDEMVKYWSTASERVGHVLLGYVLVFLEGYQSLRQPGWSADPGRGSFGLISLSRSVGLAGGSADWALRSVMSVSLSNGMIVQSSS